MEQLEYTKSSSAFGYKVTHSTYHDHFASPTYNETARSKSHLDSTEEQKRKKENRQHRWKQLKKDIQLVTDGSVNIEEFHTVIGQAVAGALASSWQTQAVRDLKDKSMVETMLKRTGVHRLEVQVAHGPLFLQPLDRSALEMD